MVKKVRQNIDRILIDCFTQQGTKVKQNDGSNQNIQGDNLVSRTLIQLSVLLFN